MPRYKRPRGLIAHRRTRSATLARRREGLKQKARELATLCGVRIALVCADSEGVTPPDVWESEEGVFAAYRALPAEARAAHTHWTYAVNELGKVEAKLAKVRLGGSAALPLWDKALDGMDREEAQRVLGDFDATLAAVEDRRRALGMPDDVLHEGVAPLRRAAPPCGGSNFVDVEGYLLGAQGDGDANGGQYEQAMWGNGLQPCSAASMQPSSYGFQQYPGAASMQPSSYGFQQYPGAASIQPSSYGFQQYPGSGTDMDGYQLQMAAGMNGYSDSNDTGIVALDAFQPTSTVPTHPGYASQSYGGGYSTQHVPSNGGLQHNVHNAVVPVGYPSLHIGLGYINVPAGHNAQDYDSSFINAPPALSHAMGTSDNFTSPAPATPLGMYASDYTMQGPAQQQLQNASSSQQSGIEQLHYFSDVEDTQFWGN